MKSLLDPKDSTGNYPFEWIPAERTDVRKTFAKFRNAAPQTGALPERSPDIGVKGEKSAVAAPFLRRAK